MVEAVADVIKRVSEQEFRSTYAKYDKAETMSRLGLSFAKFDYLVKYYSAQDITKQLTLHRHQQQKEEQLLQLQKQLSACISKNTLVQCYLADNYSFSETKDECNLTEKEYFCC